MIITLHYLNGNIGGALSNTSSYTFNYYLINAIESLCIVAVNVFIIITGYFSYKKNSVKISKVVHLFSLCVFYGLLIYIGMIIFKHLAINKDSIGIFIKTIFNRWFVLTYIVLYLVIPYINKLISVLSKVNLKILIIINVIFFYIFSTFYINTLIHDNGYGIINFVNLYLIGAYIAKYGDKKKIKKYLTIGIYLLCAILTTLMSLYTKKDAFAYSNIFNVIGAVSLFLTFKNMNIKNNKIINKISTYTFSTYIIHENAFLGIILYQTLFKCNKYYNSNLLIVNLLYTVLGIYIICILIEFIRRIIFNKLIDRNIEKIKYEIKV
jgi:surface polysaccharide O-acyltransferase-like enzyme